METSNQHSISTIQKSRRRDPLKNTALGLVSTSSFPAIVGTADMMLKSAGVHLVGYEKIGSGQCTAIVRGGIADVRLAVEAGVQTAEQFGQLVQGFPWRAIAKSVTPFIHVSPAILNNQADRSKSPQDCSARL